MNQETPPRPDDGSKPPRRTRKRRRLTFIIVGTLLVLLLLLVALLPTLLSTDLGRRIVVGRVSSRINGALKIEDWSLRWLTAIEISGMRIEDAGGKTLVSVERITAPRGLLALLGSEHDLGAVVIAQPRANLVLRKDGALNVQDLFPKSTPAADAPAPSPSPGPSADKPAGVNVHGTITVKDGELTLTPEGGAPLAVHEIQTTIRLDGSDKPIVLEQSAEVGKNRAPFTMKVSVTAPAAAAEIRLGLNRFDLSSVEGFAAWFGAPVSVAGAVSLDLAATISGPATATARGRVKIEEAAVSGEPLKGDTLNLGACDIVFDVAREGPTLTVTALRVTSPLVKAEAAGTVTLPADGAPPQGTLTAKAQADLAAILAQLPNTLRLETGASIDSGVLRFAAEVSPRDEVAAFSTKLGIEGLAATIHGRKVRLNNPLELTASGTLAHTGAQITHLDAASPFCTLRGRRNADEFNIVLKIDLAAATTEAGRFVALGGKAARGDITLALAVAGKDTLKKSLKGTIDVTGVTVDGVLPRQLALPTTRISFSGDGLIDLARQRVVVEAFSLASGTLKMKGAAQLDDWGGRRNLHAKGTHEINFEALTPFAAAALQQPIQLAGKQTRPFEVRVCLAEQDGRALLAGAFVATELALSRSEVMGIRTGAVSLPVTSKDGVIELCLKTTANDGKIELPLQVRLASDGDTVIVPGEPAILSDVTLTTEMAQRLVALASPVFRRCVVSGGTVGYVSRHARVPLGGDVPLAVDAEGVLALRGVRLASSGLVQGILDVLHVKPVSLTFPEQEVKISVRDGVIHQGPLTLHCRDYVLRIHGDVTLRRRADGGLAETLDMVADVPVTRELVRDFGGNEAVYRLLKDEFLRIPIRGSGSLPRYAADLVKTNMQRLLKSAMKKLLLGEILNLHGGKEKKEKGPGEGPREEPRPETDRDAEKDAKEALREKLRREAEKLLKERLKKGLKHLF